MNSYQQSLTLKASAAKVYAALTTPAGLRGWWTTDCNVASSIGGALHVRFGASHKEMRIERLETNREVAWLCTDAHIAIGDFTRRDEWVGTRLVFRLAPLTDGTTRLDFEHAGLAPDLECYDLCSNGWRYFLDSLQQLVESGRGTPYDLAAAA